MKRSVLTVVLCWLYTLLSSQDALHLQNGAGITIQNGVNVVLQGGIRLENGSSLLNNGVLTLKNNSITNISNWTDNSLAGALAGNGIVIFNSNYSQQFTGLTAFYAVYINTNELNLNNNLNIDNILRLINGKINTGNYYVFLVNNNASSLETDAINSNYTNSWVNGNLRRSISTNINSYDFPVGNAIRSNLLKFLNNNISGTSQLTASFGPKPGADAGINVSESGFNYTSVNNGGVWYLVPNTAVTGGNYALHLYFNGFTGLTDNNFGILRRPDASSNGADWSVPGGSLLEPLNGTGRKLSDGFARRFNISDFSQLGIGQFSTSTAPECSITGVSQVCPASTNNIYTAPAGMSSYNWIVTGSGSIIGGNNGQLVSVAAGTGSSFTLTLTTSLNGVTSQCYKTVSITTTPTCEINGPSGICSNSMNNIYSAPVNMNTYLWTVSPGLTILGPNSGASVNIAASGPGTFTLMLDATSNGCVSRCTKTITVNPPVPCSITGLSSVTTGTTGIIYTAPTGNSSYNWSITGNGTIVGSNNEQSVSVNAGPTGNYTLTLITTINGCSATCTKTVTVDPLVVSSCTITGDAETCSGTTNNIYSAPVSMDNYDWNIIGNGVIIGASNEQTVSVTAGGAGTYTLTLQTSLNGVSCSRSITVKVIDCVTACTYTQGFYGNINGIACSNNSGTTASSSELMQDAFGLTTFKVFGNVANKRFFTLFKSDITSGAIYKMLPGGGNAKAIDVDNILPYDGAYYANQSTWYLVPLQPNGPQKGRIRNSLLAQTMTLWFNLENNTSLGSITLLEDTLVTRTVEGCGSATPVGDAVKFGLPHSIVIYLNGGNGYSPTINGLLELANDVLGGVNTAINPSEIQQAVDVINNAFDKCRRLVATIPYNNINDLLLTTTDASTEAEIKTAINKLKVVAYPNPYQNNFQLLINTPVSGRVTIEFFTIDGRKVYEMKKTVQSDNSIIVNYTGPTHFSALIYKVTMGKEKSGGIVLKPN